ncbi:peptidase domain-containing ABC transporter [Alistipes timonensis]
MNKKHIHSSQVKQHDSSDCGVACLLSLIRYYGGDSTIQHLREISGTSQTGTTLLGLYQAANAIGFKAEGAEANGITDLIEHEKPTILAVLIDDKFEHYIVCYGFENGQFVIGDPASGVELYEPEKLGKIWTKKCLLLEPTEKFTRKSDIRQRKQQWLKNLLREDAGILTASVIIGVVLSVLGMVMAVFSQKLVDEVLPAHDTRKLIVGLVLVFVLLQARVFISALRSKLLITQSRDFNNRIIDFFYNRLLNLPKVFFDMRKIGDMVARLNDTRRIQTVISSLAGDTIINVLMVVVSLVFLAVYSWQIALIALLCMPVFFWVIYRHNATIIAQQREVMAGYAMTESNFISTINGIAAIKNFNRQSIFQKINQLLYAVFQGKVFDLGKTQIRIGVLSGAASVVIMLGLIAYSSFQVFNNTLSIGELMAVVGITGSLFPAVASLALITIPINEAKVAFDRMFEVVGINEPGKENSSVSMTDAVHLLEVDKLSFRFVGRKKLLDTISMRFERGAISCIVGESGCGKSTLCQILQRFYSPETGTIHLGQTDIEAYSSEQWTQMVSVVPQEVYIYNGTVLDNICFGAIPKDINEVFEFCKHYGLDKFIAELPQGLMTLVGEEGINLSGGQKQLIAFARALYKPSQILLLDEMTAAMDRKTERTICDLLVQLKKEHIIVFVTHRLETAKKIGDTIYVIADGHIQATGTHDELLQTKNFYSDYWTQLV